VFLHTAASRIARLLQAAPPEHVDEDDDEAGEGAATARTPPPLPTVVFPPVPSRLLIERFVRALHLPGACGRWRRAGVVRPAALKLWFPRRRCWVVLRADVLIGATKRLVRLDDRRQWTLCPATAARDLPCHVPLMAWVVVAAKLAYGLGAPHATEPAPESWPRVVGDPERARERQWKKLARELGPALAADVLFAAAVAEGSMGTDGDAELAAWGLAGGVFAGPGAADADGDYAGDSGADDPADMLAADDSAPTQPQGAQPDTTTDVAPDDRLPPDQLPPWEAWRRRVAPLFAGRPVGDTAALPRVPWNERCARRTRARLPVLVRGIGGNRGALVLGVGRGAAQ